MRSVSYVQRVALEFSGSLFPHAICLGDADNDTLNELVVGDTSGKLSVYKNDDSRPWLTCSCQGMLTCVGVGDVCNKGKNLVVAVTAEGWFHLFDLTPAKTLDASGHHESLTGEEQRPVFKQHIPANTKVMLISDIDGDGCHELVVGHTDRVVRAFRWEDLGEGTDHPTGQLVSLKKWTLEGQVDSLSVTPGPLGVPELMVSQPGCAYATLLCTWSKDAGPAAASEGATEGSRETPAARDVVLHQTSGRIHNKNVSTHLIGNIKRGKGPSVVCAGASPERGGSGLFALCTLDGTLKLMEEADRLLWSVQVDHQLFALEKLDVTGNGHEEVVACAWDGQTYIIDHNRAVVRFQVDENIRAFCAGLYACKEDRNSPCLVYVTFNQKIYVYWEVQLERMESTNLLKVLEAEPEYQSLLQELGVDPDDLPAAQALLHRTLYHPDQPPQGAPTSLQDPT
ncbi:KICSTOR complex protein ITFG2 [Manis javanica]|nr:KICSTOR complex protein ITFG2 isoform X1 [Manis javanica]KAI5947711.1 KICSTOR complex protein ITFG2 [Manis javanica]